jgi:predicted anti-sigma-YlaC factor YlaD
MTLHVPHNDCVQARELVSAELDFELSELDSARLSAHLRKCPACASQAREAAAITAQLRAAPLELPALEIWVPRRRRTAGALRTASVRIAAAAATVAAAAVLTSVAVHDAATTGSHSKPAGPPKARAAAPDVVDVGLLAMLRDDRSRQTSPKGRLIFV